jgi:uncharacterized protein Usg
MTPYINTELYRNEIEQLLSRYGLTSANVDYAEPDIREYCKRNHYLVNNKEIFTEIKESRTAMNFRKATPNECKILLKKHISHKEANDVIGRIIVSGFHQKVHYLEDKWFFVKHLVLHEICEVIRVCDPQYEDQEAECDAWAFREMEL